jgi:1-acyl-sn-glycerol-3-phosphate acyltransferase
MKNPDNENQADAFVEEPLPPANSEDLLSTSEDGSISEPAPTENVAGESVEPAAELSDEELRQRLASELDRLVERLQEMNPDYTPPPFSAQRLVDVVGRNMRNFSPGMLQRIREKMMSGIASDLLDMDTWKGIWYMLNYSMEYQTDILKRRLHGEYETDEWGYDPELFQTFEPFLNFMYKTYWRIETTGMENIPDEERALLVCNHSGQLPWDGVMVGTAIHNEHPSQRLLRSLFDTWFPSLPLFSALFIKLGQVLAKEDNGIRLLEQNQLVAVFPEGFKGVGKLFKDRYQLASFGGGEFVRIALRTGAPMIPVSIVGAEETYISLYKSPTLARITGFPYFPISPTFPWLGLLGFVPLPTKWYIDFGDPVPTDHYGPDSVNNLLLVSELTDQMRNLVKDMIYSRLGKRRSIFWG